MFISSIFFTISLLVRVSGVIAGIFPSNLYALLLQFIYKEMSFVSIISSLIFVVFFAVGPGKYSAITRVCYPAAQTRTSLMRVVRQDRYRG